MIIIENPQNLSDERAILRALGKEEFDPAEEVTLDDALHPNDKSICIGFHQGNILITDDYQITTTSLERNKSLELTSEERGLVDLFPHSEILLVACHSVVSYHGYALIKNGRKVRLKTISADDPLIEAGERLPEEKDIYATASQREGRNYWKNPEEPGAEFTEDQLMEEFTFGIVKRRLGVRLDQEEGWELVDTLPMKKYRKPGLFIPGVEPAKNKKSRSKQLIAFGIAAILYVIWRILRANVFKD